MDSRYISFELLRKVPATAVFGQVGNDKPRIIANQGGERESSLNHLVEFLLRESR